MSRRKQINCAHCDNEKLTKNVIGLNKKLIHPEIERVMCLVCLAEYLEATEEDL